MPLMLDLQSIFFPNGSGLFVRASTAVDGTQADRACFSPAFSADGRYVAFSSMAGNLIPNGSSAIQHIYRKDLKTNAVSLVSTNAANVGADDDSDRAQISANGRYVVFESKAINLEGDQDADGSSDIFRKDLDTGAVVRVSTSSTGVRASAGCYSAQLSADGNAVVFESDATNLGSVPDDGTTLDIFHKDIGTGKLTLVSSGTDGTRANSSSSNAQVTADGRYVIFETDATNLVPSDENGSSDIFIKNVQTGVLERVSVTADGVEGNLGSYGAKVSANGRYVVFESDATNLVDGDTNDSTDIYRKDLLTGAVERVSIGAGGIQGEFDCYRAQISGDGRYVVFQTSSRNLAPGDTNTSNDVFRKDMVTGELVLLTTTLTPAQGKQEANSASLGGQIHTVAQGSFMVFESNASNFTNTDGRWKDVFHKNLTTGETICVSMNAQGQPGNRESFDAQFSPDGRSVMFTSAASNFVTGDTNNTWDIFLKNLDSNAITHISAAANGTQANGMSRNARFSADGKHVVFESMATNLVADDTNGAWDIFVKNLDTLEVKRASTSASWSEVQGNSSSAEISDDARYVIFQSSSAGLVENDTNNREDIFRKDMTNGTIVRVSTNSMGGQVAGGDSIDAHMSADGRYVVFTSRAVNIVTGDTNALADVFRKDMSTGAVVRVSTTAGGGQATGGASDKAKISSNGQFVAFVSSATNLVAGDDNGRADIFLKDMSDGTLRRVSVTADNAEFTGSAIQLTIDSVSDDGVHVVFSTNASNVVEGDHNTTTDIFRKNMQTGVIERLSMTDKDAQGNVPANGSSNLPQIRFDGHFAVVETISSNMTAGDTNGQGDIYVIDTAYMHKQAMEEGRFVEVGFNVGAASSVSMDWGDGSSEAGLPLLGNVTFRHAYATTGTKSATVTVREADKTRDVPYTINLAGKAAARNTALSDTLSGGAGGDQLTGDGFANVLIGNGGDDDLSGGMGGDILDGGTGADTAVFSGQRADYVIVKDAAGVITVTDKQAGRDGADVLKNVDFARFADQTLDLASLPTGTGTGGGGTGGVPVAKILIGTKARDVLTGGQGNDKLYGGYGNDVLTGGAGQDVFVFNAKLGTARTDRKVNFDRITDFSVKDDTLWLDNKYMAKLGKGTELKPGKLSKKFFVVGDKAKDGNDYLIYNRKTGVLSYDADGNGAGEAIEVAQLARNLKITSADFMIV